MGGCSAINCSNHSRKGFQMARLPKNEERRKKWIINMRRENWQPGPSAQICIGRSSPCRYSTTVDQEIRQTFLENETARFVQDFLIKVEEIYEMFSKTDEKIEDVVNIHTAVLEFSETDERLFTFYENIKKSFAKIAEKISDLENSFDVTKFFGTDTELRICSTQLLTLKRKLTCSVSDYYNIQEEYKEKCRTRVKRQARISGANLSTTDFDSAIESKTDFFLQVIFPDYNVANYYVTEIKRRHEDFLRLEKSIMQLRDLIFEMNIILTADAVLINRIDKHSKVVDQYVMEGSKHTKDYKSSLKTHRFKYYVCFCCVGFFVIIIVLAILTTLT